MLFYQTCCCLDFFLASLILIVLVYPANAESILVVTEDNFKPYNYTVNERPAGIATEAVKEILDASGLEYKIEFS